METATLGRTFFPGSKKEIRVQTITLLENTEETKRIKMDCLMPFADGKVVGMPEWVGTAFDHLGKEGTLERSTKFEHAIEEMSLYIFETPEQKDPSRTSMLCQLKNFTMTREKEDEEDEELGDVGLKFVLYAPGDKRLWTWLYDFIHKKLFVRFECTQAELSEETKAPETQLSLDQSQENIKAFTGKPLVGDEHDEARREANSKEHDEEFNPPKANGKDIQPPAQRRPRGFDRAAKGVD